MPTLTHPTVRPVAQAFRPAAASRARGFSIAEILVSMAILLVGVVAIAAFFPASMRQNQRAVDSSTAAFLAQMKFEEVRRDDLTDTSGVSLVDTIRSLAAPTDPVTFAFDPRFAYSFCGRSLLNPAEPPSARVIVRYAATYRPQQEILFEVAFQ